MESTFIIIREDLQVDPVTIVAEGLLVGRLPTCELLLNHPSVSRLHAGITNAESDFYIRNLRPANPILLNGEKLEDYEALAAGDVRLFSSYPLIPFSTRVYDEHVKNIGSLDDDMVAPIVEFYGYLGYINSLQILRDQYKKHSNEREFEKQYDESLTRLLREFQTQFDQAFERYKLHVQ